MLVGVVFGLVAAGVLGLPLAASLPARAVSGWFSVSHDVALLASVVSLALPALAGFVAAWLDPDDPIRSGAGAGVVTALLAGTAVVMPATQVAPAIDVLIATSTPNDRHDPRLLVAEGLIGGQWDAALAGLALLLVTPALGAVGGLVHDLWQGRRGGVARLVHRSSVPLVAAWVVLGSIAADLLWTAHLDASLLERLGHPPDRARLTSLLATTGVAQSLLLAWMLRDALLLVRARRRMFGLLWSLLAVAPSVLTGVVVLALHPRAALAPAFWIGGAMVVATVLGTVVVHWQSDAELHERPRTFWDLLGEGAAMGIVCVALGSFTGLTPILGTRLLFWPILVSVLQDGVPLDVSPPWLVGRVYLAHLGSMGGMVLVGLAYAVLATPIWLIARAVFVRASARGAR